MDLPFYDWCTGIKKLLGYREKEMLQCTCLQIAHKLEKFYYHKGNE